MSVHSRLAHGLWLVALPLLVGVVAVAGLRADAGPHALDVSQLAGGVPVVGQAYVLEDATAALTLQEVVAASRSFVPVTREPSFGFTRSAFWIRFVADNPGPLPQAWLLDVSYPPLDHLDLHALHADGREQHWSAGDRLPFAARPVKVATFVFPQETAARGNTTYYLRVQSAGTVRIPLRAWLPLDFLQHESEQNLVLWLFYGVVAAMTCFNFGTATLLRRREHSLYVGLMISLGGAIFTLSGQTFQYLLPNSPDLANRALGTFMALGLIFMQLYAREVCQQVEGLQALLSVKRVFAWTLPPSLLLLPIALFGPQTIAQLAVFVGIIAYIPFGVFKLRMAQKHASPELRFYMLSFYCLAITIPVALLAHAKLIPPFPLAIWAGHIGCASYSILTSLSLPVRVNDMSRKVAGLNEQLSANVADLKRALARAERATKVKDEFMATMSHELRTPLNAIINVPQGLLEDFPSARSATCGECRAEFLLDEGEQLDSTTVCGRCAGEGTLQAGSAIIYVGKPAHTARFLRKIERSGQHLLQMVNGVLDFSKMEAGRLELAREPLDLRSLLTEVVDQVSELALARDLSFALTLSDSTAPCFGDAMRLRQVMLNLLSNAIKFSHPGSKIGLTWTRASDADTIHVSDQGIGIAPGDHERVFASFEQVHKGDTRKYGGTGLGLSISRSLVRMHGGELWVKSQLGAGATFSFTLPRHSTQIAIVATRASAVA